MGIVDSDIYFGLITEEGLTDPLSFNKIDCVVNRFELIRNPKNLKSIYHLYSVELKGSELKRLPQLIHKKEWYFKFFHQEEIIIVYPNQIFIINRKTKSGLEKAQVLGKKLKIGEDHLANLIPPKGSPKMTWSVAMNNARARSKAKGLPQEKSFLDSWNSKKSKS